MKDEWVEKAAEAAHGAVLNRSPFLTAPHHQKRIARAVARAALSAVEADIRAETRAERDRYREALEAFMSDWLDNWKNATPEERGSGFENTGMPVSGSVFIKVRQALKGKSAQCPHRPA